MIIGRLEHQENLSEEEEFEQYIKDLEEKAKKNGYQT